MKKKFKILILLLLVLMVAPVLSACQEVGEDVVIKVLSSSIVDGSVEGGGTYKTKDTLTLSAKPEKNKEFVAWIKNNVEVSTEADYTFTLEKNSAGLYIAVFTSTIPNYYKANILSFTGFHKLQNNQTQNHEVSLLSIDYSIIPFGSNQTYSLFKQDDLSLSLLNDLTTSDIYELNSNFYVKTVSSYNLIIKANYQVNDSLLVITKSFTLNLSSLTLTTSQTGEQYYNLITTLSNNNIEIEISVNLTPAMPKVELA